MLGDETGGPAADKWVGLENWELEKTQVVTSQQMVMCLFYLLQMHKVPFGFSG